MMACYRPLDRRDSYLLISAMVLFSHCFVISYQYKDPPEIMAPIDGLTEVEEGLSPTLSIEVRGKSPLYFVWKRDDVIVQNSTSRYLDIKRATVTDTGDYVCIIENEYGTVVSLPFKLSVKVLGKYTAGPDQIISVEEGKFVVLKPEQLSHLTKKYRMEWLFNDLELDTNSVNYHLSQKNNLAILNVPASYNNRSYKAKFTHLSIINLTSSTSHSFVLLVTNARTQDTFSPPEFVLRPDDATVISGINRDVKFECVINARPLSNLQITWYRGTGQSQTLIDSNNKYFISPFRRVLTIRNLEEADSGKYECKGSLNEQATFSPISSEFVLTVQVKPTISPAQSIKVTKDFQESFSLTCSAEGTPDPQIKWIFNGNYLTDDGSSRHEVFPNGTLSIRSVDLPDSGVYQCMATNDAGTASSYTYLLVNSAKPEMIQGPKDKIVAEGEDTDLTCKVKGGPQPEVYWTKDGANVTLKGRIRKTADSLLLGQVRMSDSGQYACHAVNIKGMVSSMATLSVIVKTTIIKPPQNMSKILNTDAMLECGVRKDDSVAVTWKWSYFEGNDYTEIISDATNKRILGDGSLVIYGVLGSDSGKYKCEVTSDGGNDERIAILNVIDLPAAPTIQSVTLYDAQLSSVKIDWTLSYDGDTPIIKFVIQIRLESSLGSNIDSPWETIESHVDPSLRSFVVKNLLPARYYRFRMIAVNNVGESPPSRAAPVANAIKMPSRPPGEAPKNLFCVQGEEREIRVQWEPPPESSWNGELKGYRIFYKVDAFKDDTEKVKEVSGKDTRTSILNNLAYNKRYRIKIAAVNEKGAGVNSSAFHITTLQGKPSAPPSNVELSSPNSTIITIEWNPPQQRLINGINLGYVIEVWTGMVLKRTENVRFNEQNPTGRQTYNIINLSKYTEYEIRIACRTAPGPGPFSPEKSIRTLEDVPGPVSDLKIDNIRAKSLRVNWKPPNEINGALRGYRITYSVKNNPSESFTEDRGADATSHTLNDLRYETTYVISVQAKTQMGFGPERSTEIDSGVPPELPGPASSLAVSNIKSRSVKLQFIQGNNGKTSILLWIVEAQVEDDTTWKEIYSISDPNANQITVLNLKPFTYYRLRIIKKNIVDFSEPSLPCSRFQTLQDLPGMPPENVTPRAVSSTSIRIRWKQIPRTEWNGDFLGYKIFYRLWSLDVDLNTTTPETLNLVRQSEWSVVQLRDGSNIQEYSLEGLQQWMDYEIKMVSYNAYGNSPFSPILTERTEEDVPSASPIKIQPFASSSTSVDVSWAPVPILERNGNIMGYKIKYKADLPNEEPQYLQIDGPDTLTAQLTGLFKFVHYDIQILAFSRMGDGVLSRVYTVRTSGDEPGPPVGIYFPDVTLTSATIRWQEPERPNGFIIAYRVAYRRTDEPQFVMDNNAKDLTSKQLELKVENLDQEITYVFSVQAKTEDGWGEAATVKVYTFGDRDCPDAPSNVRVDLSATKSRSVTISWSPGNDNYGPVRNFIIQYKPKNGEWLPVEETIGPALTTYTVTGLKPNSLYTFRVAARNDIGASNFSAESVEAHTDSDKPDGAPQNVQITALTRTSIKITWEAPNISLWNSEILMGYQVRYRQDALNLPWRYEYTDGKELIAKAQHGAKYICSVQANNLKGGGHWSQAVLFYLEIAPSAAPLDVAVINKSSTVIEVTWRPPPPESTNGDLTGYKVSYWESLSDVCIDVPDPDHRLVAGSPALLENLRPYIIYCVTVQALNIVDKGPKTPAMSVRTLEDLPGLPTSMSFANITLKELIVHWEPPAIPNGKITRYQLEYYVSLDSQKTDKSTQRLPGDLRQLHVRDLFEKSQYTFTLAAYTSIGPGNKTIATVFTGPQKGSPEAPLQPTITIRQKNLYLTWVNQGEGESSIYGYQIHLHESGTPNDEWPLIRKEDGPAPSARIGLTNLKPKKEYQFLVRAINAQGISPPSLPTEIYISPSSLEAKSSTVFHKEWWFLVIVALSGVIVILLLVTFLCFGHKRNKEKMKRSSTNTTVMSELQDPVDNGFPSLDLRQSRRSLGRPPKPPSNNIYARTPPRPSPASVLYAEGGPPPFSAGAAAAAASKPPMSDTSSELSEKPSNLGDSSAESCDDSDDSSSNDSIVKAPVPASPPPPAFSRHYSTSSNHHNSSSGAAATSSTSNNPASHNSSSWRFQNTNNAYQYTDSEAESSHYAFSLTGGNIVVNNVAGARTPLSGFSSFV